MTFFDLVLQTRGSLHPDGEPDRFISEHTGYILADRNGACTRRVGKVHAYRIHADLAAQSGEPLFDVCDAHSHELHVLHSLVYEPDQYRFKEALIDRFDALDCDCLVLDYIVLHPRWRGLKLGLLAARKMVDLLGGGCGLVVAHIAPLNSRARDLLRVPVSWLPPHETADTCKAATVKLRGYFRQMGFERLGQTPFYALPLAQETPTLAELLRPSAQEE